MISLNLHPLEPTFAVCRFPADQNVPQWALEGAFFNITRTYHELSIVCVEQLVPPYVRFEGSWKGFMLEGPFDFGQTGILSSVLEPLAEAKIGIFTFSTFDTDYVLVKEANLEAALAALKAAGHRVGRAGGAQ
jgi:uncharacterized protein